MFCGTRLHFVRVYTTRELNIALSHMGLTMTDASDAKMLKKKYHDLVRRNHPDAGGDERTMKDVINAFQVLSETLVAEKEQHYADTDPPKGSKYKSVYCLRCW